MGKPKTAAPKKVKVSAAPAKKPAVVAVITTKETKLQNDFTEIIVEGKVGSSIPRPGLEKKYPGPGKAGLDGYDRYHMAGPDATGAEEAIVYAPRNFNVSKTAELENIIRNAQEQAELVGGEVYITVKGIVKKMSTVESVEIRVLKEIEFTVEIRMPGSDKLIPLVKSERYFLKPPPGRPGLFRGFVPKAVGGVACFAAPIIVQEFIHKPAVEKRIADQAKKEGYVAMNAPSEKGFLYDLGAWFLDPFKDAEFSVGMDKRFDVKVWRQRLKQATDAKRPGETFEIEWDVGLCSFDFLGRQSIQTRKIVYRKQADGSWKAESGDTTGVVDLNFILEPGKTDEEIQRALLYDPCIA